MFSRLALLVTGICWCGSVLAAEPRATHIPAQALSSGLLVLSQQYDMQLIYVPDEIGGLQTPGAEGTLGFEDALRQLLRGTNLQYRYVDERTVTILPVRIGTSPEAGVTAQKPAETRGPDGARGQTDRPAELARRRPEPEGELHPAAVAALDEVRIAGSRVARDGLEASTPVKVMYREELLAAAPLPIADALNQLPEFKNSQTPASTGISTTGNAGQSFLNLRSLGVERTLVLLNGRRVVPSNANGTVDISVLPENLVERVDVVTGGASAVYGSDAVAGIVNFVLDTDFTGLELQGQTGGSTQGDSRHERLAITAGTASFDGRVHLLGSASLYTNDGVAFNSDRDWFESCSRIVNPGLVPNQVVACDVHSAQFTRGGLITAGPLRGIEFGPGGNPQKFDYGSLATDSSMVGGGGEDHALAYQLVPETTRRNAYGRFSIEVAPRVTAYVEGFYGTAAAAYRSTSPWQGQTTGYTIYSDNAFLPENLRASMTSAGISSFPLSRYDHDFGALQIRGLNRTSRAVAGLEAGFGRWSLDVYYTSGVNRYGQTIDNNVNVNRIYNAADAVVDPATGSIVCRSTLLQPANGCVPLNLFGYGSPSPAALDWVLGTATQDLRVEQRVFEASLAGEPFKVPAGRVSLAFGVGWREEASLQRTDATSQSPRIFTGAYRGWPESVAFAGQVGGWERSNPLPLEGSYSVAEAFAETIVPVLQDAPWARLLQVNAAVRRTHYSSSGGVTSWKTGFVYQPTQALRVRATRSRDIRAPNITELYRGPINGVGVITDPFQPLDSPYRRPYVLGSNYGNPDLVPETGDTRSVGLVYQPQWLPQLSASVDYYDIDLKGGITTLGGQRTVDQCFAGTAFLCDYLIRDARGVLIATRSPYLNVLSRETDGVDIDVAYRTPGSPFTLRAVGNFTNKLTTATPGAALLNEAGQNGINGVPHWSAKVSIAYDTGPTSVYLQQRYISGGRLDNSLSPAVLAPQQNRVSSVFYTDASFALRRQVAGGSLEILGNVSNLLDRDPPSAPSAYFVFGTTATNAALYDVIGRVWSLQLRYRY
ncbi:MAG TPA: TonB-dependent receptor [Steroidobacteraceae bacterium]|nr:TonB-dependent receptor [Steroidobacteraceae bacterium]